MPNGPPDGATLIDGATKRVPHQLFTYDAANKTYGGRFPPRKLYQLTMHEAQVKVHPDYGPTTVWGFDGQVPGPIIQARYGEPVVVRFRSNLPSVKVPQSFGIAEMTTHLHNGHTPTESDGNPVGFFNSVQDSTRSIRWGSRTSIIRTCMRATRPGTTTSAIRPRRTVRCGITTTTSSSLRRTCTRACSAATRCPTRLMSAMKGLACACRAGVATCRSSSTTCCSTLLFD